MATSYPASLDSFTNPTAVDTLDSPPHDTQHADANDAIEALQAKVGVDSSAVTTSLDYRVAQLETGGGGMTVSSTAPSSPVEGDMWYDDTSGRTYVYYDDGSSQQWVEFGAPPSGIGKILQVVRATDSTRRTSTSTSYVDTGLSVTITPTDSANDILLLWFYNARVATSGVFLLTQITDSSNNTISGAEGTAHGATSVAGLQTAAVLAAFDSPATTSAITYKARYKAGSAGTVDIMNNQSIGQMYAIEVSA